MSNISGMRDDLEDFSLNMDIPESSFDFMNDPELQRELQLLGSHNDASVVSPKINKSNMNNSLLDLSDEFDEDVKKEYEKLSASLMNPGNYTTSHQSSQYKSPQLTSTSVAENLIDFEDVIPDVVIDEDAIIRNCTNYTIARQTATRHQKEGNTTLALKWFRRMKELTPTQSSSSMSKSQTATSNSMGGATSAHKAKSPISSPQSGVAEAFAILEEALVSAEQQNLNEAKRLKDLNPKEAVVKMKNYKYYNQELSVLRARRNVPGCWPATFRWETRSTEIKVEHLDVGEDQVKVIVEGLYGLDPVLNGKSLSIEYYIGYSSAIEEALAKGSISTVKINDSNNGVCNHQMSYNIVKRGKTAQSTFSRKKARFDIIKSGLFSKKIIGTAVVSFNEFMSSCEIGGDIPLTEDDKSRSKKIGGLLRVTLKLRQPLSNIQKKIIEERVLVLGPWPDPTTVLVNEALNTIAAATSRGSKSSLQTEDIRDNSISEKSEPEINGRLEPVIDRPKESIQKTLTLTEREMSDPFAVELLESNDVMEDEIKLAKSQLSKGKLEETDRFVLSIRLQALQLRLNLLQQKVGEEVLTLPEYLDILRNRIKRDEEIMRFLHSRNDMDNVKRIQVC